MSEFRAALVLKKSVILEKGLSGVRAALVQALSTSPAAEVLGVPGPTAACCVIRFFEDQLVTALASRSLALAVVTSTKQPLIGPEVNEIDQYQAAHGADEAGRVPPGAVPLPLGKNHWAVLVNHTTAARAGIFLCSICGYG